jgi:battenin
MDKVAMNGLGTVAESKESHIRRMDRVAMFVVGIINNMPYVIGIASAANIVENFGFEGWLGVIMFANTVSGLFARFICSWLIAIGISYESLFVANLIMMFGGLVACAVAGLTEGQKHPLFAVVILGIFLIGCSSSLGESVMLCYMTHRRKEDLLKPWGSGTGMAGILGAGYSFLMAYGHVSDFWSYIVISPVAFVYGLLFFLIIRKSPDEMSIERDESVGSNNNGYTPSLSPPQGTGGDIEDGLLQHHASFISEKETVSVFDCSYFGLRNWFFMFNCGGVYFLEYVIQGVFADCSFKKAERKAWTFPLLNLCYQIGVFISRSSLMVFHFPWVWILTLVQLGFFTLWLFQGLFHFMPLAPMIITMICVGLFGGCSYVNVFHLMMNDKKLSTKQKEMVTSYNAFWITVAIVLSTGFTLLAENTFMKPDE